MYLEINRPTENMKGLRYRAVVDVISKDSVLMMFWYIFYFIGCYINVLNEGVDECSYHDDALEAPSGA